MQTKLPRPETARVFFALWPSPDLQKTLARLGEAYRNGYSARQVRPETIHLTLLFLGEVERTRLPELMQAAARVAFAPFTFRLQQILCWKHNHIAFATSAAEVPELGQLAMRLRQEVEAAGFQFDRRDFALHVTLLRNVKGVPAPQSIPPVVWPVHGFSLVESEATGQGSRYRLLATWPQAPELGGRTAG